MTYVAGIGVVVFGGARACGVAVVRDSSLWSWNGAQWRVFGAPLPSRREDALLAYDSRRRVLVLYGGRVDTTVYRDMWEWSDERWQPRGASTDSGPGRLEHASIAYDARRGRVVVFGGGTRTGRPFDATWEWDGARWSQRAARGPAARVGHAMTWSESERAVLLYGGFNASGSFRDLWKWDGAAWTRLDSAGPATTEGPAIVSTERGPMLVGTRAGSSGPTTALGVWLWRDGRWTELDAGTGPRTSVGPGVAYDPTRKRLVVFGGYFQATDRSSGETWEFDGSRWRMIVDAAAR